MKLAIENETENGFECWKQSRIATGNWISVAVNYIQSLNHGGHDIDIMIDEWITF